MMKKIVIIVLSVLVLGSLLVTGCPSPAPAPAPPGKELNLYGIDPLTLDPAVSGEMTSHGYVMELFSGLVRLDDNLEPVPDIAQSWQLSDDGRTYTFHLRRGVKFHDGRPVTAADIKYSWERACRPETASQTAASYLNDIVGAEEVLAGRATELSGARVIDDYTLEVTIDAPRSYFLAKLSYPTAFVVDRNNVASGKDWWHQPNGTGPFRLKQWQKNSLLVLEKNELYYGQIPKVDTVVFHLYAGVPINMYETSKIDTASVAVSYIDKVSDKSGPFYQDLKVFPELSLSYIGFNTTRPPFDDANLRRAFALAIDKEKLVSLVFRDMAQPARGILPPAMPGYNENLIGLGYDPELAKELIANSSYDDVANLPPITITTLGQGGLISGSLEAIIGEWRQNLGVEVKVRQLEEARFMYHLEEEVDEMFFSGWVADYPHPQDFLGLLFHSGAEYNYGGYSNTEVDSLLDRAGVELERQASLALYRQAEQKLVSDAASIPLWFGKNYVLVKPYVSGYELNPLGIAMLNRVSIKPH
ncbi:MAG: peptide ABC transporter substrate-binding protein [Dehalococcoidales bacterium]|nr:peptide ABC transporter substrate-binding protein [Dehalococcoidales bacterium]